MSDTEYVVNVDIFVLAKDEHEAAEKVGQLLELEGVVTDFNLGRAEEV